MSAELEADPELFGDDDEDEPQAQPAANPSQSQTQPHVANFLNDIFGDDSDDEGIKGAGGGGSDDELNDSDDDVTTKSRLKKKKDAGAGKKKKGEKKAKGKDKEKGKGKDKDKGSKKRKAEVQVTSSGRISKKPSAPSSKAKGDGSARADDGDEYDSDNDLEMSKEDRNFIAGEDDAETAGVMKEYDAEDQNFDDERPRKKSKGGDGRAQKDLDPFSETLLSMKKPKVQEIGDNDKNSLALSLLREMDLAQKRDEERLRENQPAIFKLHMLERVQKVVNVKALQNALLDLDILAVFVDWIKPLSDKSLPSLTLRSAVYEMLAKLPCQTEHLKRRNEGKQTIGMAIVSLLKSKQETEDNKRRLKALVEKWSRPIYGKQVDARHAGIRDNIEVSAAATAAALAAAAAAHSARKRDTSDVFAAGPTTVDPNKRVKTPYSNGFLFTVKPEQRSVEKTDSSAALGASRSSLMKKMKDSKGNAFGKKINPRAMDMALSGRNKT